MSMTTDVVYVDKHGAKARTGLSVRTLDYARARGDLAFYRVGRKVCFRVTDLDRYMERFRVDVAAVAGVAR